MMFVGDLIPAHLRQHGQPFVCGFLRRIGLKGPMIERFGFVLAIENLIALSQPRQQSPIGRLSRARFAQRIDRRLVILEVHEYKTLEGLSVRAVHIQLRRQVTHGEHGLGVA